MIKKEQDLTVKITVKQDHPNIDLLVHVADCFSHLVSRREELTGPQYAERIKKHYDIETGDPRTKAAYEMIKEA